MTSYLIYPIGTSASCRCAAEFLKKEGIPLIDHISPEITHLLLDIPCSLSASSLQETLRKLPDSVAIFGGRIPHISADTYFIFDLLNDEEYLIKNAAITAECALQVMLQNIPFTICRSRILILGWGRIAKPLLQHLIPLRAEVSVCSRSQCHLSEAEILGARPVSPELLPFAIPHMDVIINTAPALVIPEEIAATTHAVKIDLASSPGIEGKDVIRANGLPGKLAPRSSGELIAQTIIKHLEAAK